MHAKVRLIGVAGAIAAALLGCGDVTTSDDRDGGAAVDSGSATDPDSGAMPDAASGPAEVAYPIVDTQQVSCYGTNGGTIDCPESESDELFGQDAWYRGRIADYSDNGDGTVTDHNTGLMWQQDPDMYQFSAAEAACAAADTGGHSDWRVPSIKELYSLMSFNGSTGTASPDATGVPDNAVPYLDTAFFTFFYGTEYDDPNAGDRYIDAQYLTTTVYTSVVFGREEAYFGVNFADGRIKGYPTRAGRSWFLRCVRGGGYGANDFADNGDGTVSDRATGLMWTQGDSGHHEAGELGDGTLDWPGALSWCNGLELGGRADWRLPDAKELQGVVDYGRAPDTTSSAAIDPLFQTTSITNEAGDTDYPYFWSSTTHLDGRVLGTDAAYVSFGRALGYMRDDYMDVHGAGAQRGDPKTGARSDAECGHGPQGDCRRIFNFARCVRDE